MKQKLNISYKTFVFLLILCLSNACTSKIHTNEVTFKKDIAYYNDKPFSGEIWTDDDKSGFFVTKDGKLKSLTFFHENGNTAINMTVKDSGAPVTQIYDEDGNTMDFVSFQQKYMKLFIKIAMVQGQFLNK